MSRTQCQNEPEREALLKVYADRMRPLETLLGQQEADLVIAQQKRRDTLTALAATEAQFCREFDLQDIFALLPPDSTVRYETVKTGESHAQS